MGAFYTLDADLNYIVRKTQKVESSGFNQLFVATVSDKF